MSHLRDYLEILTRSKNSILFDIPEFGFQPESSDRFGYSMSRHRPTQDYPLEDQALDIARLNLWFNTKPWDQGNTVSRKVGRFGITFSTPLVEPLFGNIVIFTVIMSSITVFDGV